MRAAARGPLPVDGHATMCPYAAINEPVLFAFVWLATPVHFIVRSISPLVGGNKLPQLKHMDYCIHSKRKVNNTCKVNFLSIKQYNWILVKDANPFEIMEEIKKVIEPIFFECMSKNIMTAAQVVIDARGEQVTWNDTSFAALEPRDGFQYSKKALPEKDRLHRLVDEMVRFTDHLHKINSVTFSPADIGYTVCMLPGPDAGDVVFRVFSELKAYNDALKTSSLGEDFSYWDNVDKDDHVSDEEWENRKNYWENMPRKAFSDMGLSFSHPTVVETQMALNDTWAKLHKMRAQ